MGVINEINGVATAATGQDDTASVGVTVAAVATARAVETAARIASVEKEVTAACKSHLPTGA